MRPVTVLSGALLTFTLAQGSPAHERYLVFGAGKFEPQERVGICGAETEAGRIIRFFDEIRAATSSNDIKKFDKFYASAVTIGSHGKTYTAAKERIERSNLLRLSLRDWDEIGERSKTKLGSGGWRGCFLSDGKAFFEVQKDGELKLTAFDKDRRWTD